MRSDRLAHSTETALRERVKELACLYEMAQIAGRPGISMEEILQGIADLLPPAWQYPEITMARITLDGRAYATPGFRESRQKQMAHIVVRDAARGAVEVVYGKK